MQSEINIEIITIMHVHSTLRLLAALFLGVALFVFQGCSRGSQSNEDIPSFDEVKAAVPEVVSPDELAAIIRDDTLHNKIVYIFSAVCKPCMEHLREDIAPLCAQCDTSQWSVFLVATFAGLSHCTFDSLGNPIEDSPMENICYYADEYHKLMKKYGIDSQFLHLVYSPDWQRGTGDSPFTPFVRSFFHADQPFSLPFEGVPQFLRADRHNCVQICFARNFRIQGGDTVSEGERFTTNDFALYNKSYFDTVGFYSCDTAISYSRSYGE